MKEEKFSAEDSLRLIQSMIEKAKEDFSRNSFFYLLWGWLIFIAALAQYVLMVIVEWPEHYLVWNLMWVGGIVSFVYGAKSYRRERVKTYMSESMSLFGIGTCISFSILVLVFSYHQAWYFALPVFLVLYGFCSFVGAAILRFAPLRWAAIGCWIISVVAVFVKYEVQLLLMALAVLAAYIIPGYWIRAKEQKQIG